MASTYSTNLGLELIATGEQSGTWGATTNANFGTLTEQAIVGYSTQAVTDSGSATVLTIANGASSTGRNYVIALTGALTAARTVEVPAVNKPYIFFNSTTGGFAVTVKVTGQTGVVIANGKKAIVYTNTTDVIEVANAPATEAGTQTLTNKTLTAPVIATIVNTGTLTLPTSTDTLVGRATTDTLTNKTLTSPLIGTVIGGTTASSSLTLQSTSGVGTTDSILFKVGNNGATTAMTVDTSGNVGIATGNLTFSGTGQRITGDFSSTSPISNRVLFQTSTTNATTIVSAIPNGTGTQSNFNVYNSSDAANASDFRLLINSTDARLLTAYSGTGTYLPMTFYTGGSEAMRIGATAGTDKGTVGIGYSALTGVGVNGLAVLGNVGIGTSSPTQKLHVNGGNILVGTAGSNAVLYLDSASTYVRRNSSDGSLVFNNQAASNTIFTTNASETMRIDSSGNVGIGTSSPLGRFQVVGSAISNPVESIFSTASGDTAYQATLISKYDNDTTTSQVFIRFAVNNNGTTSGQINANGANSAAFGTWSDERLKDNIVNLPSQLANICALRPVEFDYKDGSGHQIGFVAQEMKTVYPDAVGTGTDDMLTITGWSKTEARLVAAIQELAAKVAALEGTQ